MLEPVTMPTVSTAVRSSRGQSDAPVRLRGYSWDQTDAPVSVSVCFSVLFWMKSCRLQRCSSSSTPFCLSLQTSMSVCWEEVCVPVAGSAWTRLEALCVNVTSASNLCTSMDATPASVRLCVLWFLIVRFVKLFNGKGLVWSFKLVFIGVYM